MTNSELMYFPSATIAMEEPISTTIHISDINAETQMDILKAITLNADNYTGVMKPFGRIQDIDGSRRFELLQRISISASFMIQIIMIIQ